MRAPGQNTVPTQPDGCGILSEAHFGESSRGVYESVARRRFQDPKPVRLGKWWYILVWQDEFRDGRRVRKRKREKLAPGTMPVREVNKIAAERLRPVNQGLLTAGSAALFEEYVNNVMASNTQARYRSVIGKYLVPTSGGSCLRDLTPLTVQKYFSGMADSDLSHESRGQIRDVMPSILGSVVQYGYLVKNPVEGLKLPPCKTGRRSKPYITPQAFVALVALISEPYATMVFLAVYTGLRVSEVIGLRWRNVHEESISVEQRYCRGDWGPPKSEASNATVPVNGRTLSEAPLAGGICSKCCSLVPGRFR